MEEYVNGIRETFYGNIVEDYLRQDEEKESFLYKAFWRENVAGLLKMLDKVTLHKKKIFPGLLEELNRNFQQLSEDQPLQAGNKPKTKGRMSFYNFTQQLEPKHEFWLKKQLEELVRKHGQQLRALMEEHRQHPDELTGEQKQQAGCLPLKKKERWDFWKELWLNDAYYKAGLITDMDYYLWLAECLSAHGTYYTDKNNWVWDGHTWLYVLLLAGLEDTALDPCRLWGEELQGNDLGENPENNFDREQAEKNLKKLAGLIKAARNPKEVTQGTRGAKDARLLLRKLEKTSIHTKKLVPKNISDTKEQVLWNKKNETVYVLKSINVRNKAQVGRDLAALAKMMQEEKEKGESEVACRLQGLKYPEKINENSVGWVEYLLWLTRQLERMAIHSNIKTWLQDSGYTIGKKEKEVEEDEGEEDEEEYELKKSPMGPRKQDFTMRLFEEYYDSTKEYAFKRASQGAEVDSKSPWQVSMGFCVLEPEQHEKLRDTMKKSKNPYFYLPLAVDLRSGCIFFLSGSGNYAELYKNQKTKNAEEDKKAYIRKAQEFNCCFDYFRLDEKDLESAGNMPNGNAFRLKPTFHLNAEKSAQVVLEEFKRYCILGDKSPRHLLRGLNMQAPAGIPEAFRTLFERANS